MVMTKFFLFFLSCLLGGLGGAVGSIIGHAAGQTGLWIGGTIGGLLGSIAAVTIARARHWILDAQFVPATLGASVGFIIAAWIAVHTLSSPLGPVLSTTLIGMGALVGSATRRRADREAARDDTS
jgi:hypothetical protein